MNEQFANAAQSTLTSAIDGVATSLNLTSGAAFPAAGQFSVIVDAEIMLATARTGNVITVTRGAEGTAAVPHANGATVTCIITARVLAAISAQPIQGGDYLAETNGSPYSAVGSIAFQTTGTITKKISGKVFIAASACPSVSLGGSVITFTLLRDATPLPPVRETQVGTGNADEPGDIIWIDTLSDTNPHQYTLSITTSGGTLSESANHISIVAYEMTP